MPSDLLLPLAASALILLMVGICAARRVPVWHPIYFFGLLFALEIAFGYGAAWMMRMSIPARFTTPLLGAYVLFMGVLLACVLRDGRRIRRAQAPREIFASVRLTPGTVTLLTSFLAFAVILMTITNAIVTLRWGALPVIAFDLHRTAVLGSMKGVPIIPSDAGREFLVPGLSAISLNLVVPAVVAYFIVVISPKYRRGRLHPGGWRSVPPWVHLLLTGLFANAAVHYQRNVMMMAGLTLVLLLTLNGTIQRKLVIIVGLIMITIQLGLGAARRGGGQYEAAEALGLPPVAGATIVYEPAIYLGTGIPNLYVFWRRNDPHGLGQMLLGPMLPRPVSEFLGFSGDSQELLRTLSAEGYALPGETLRTPWFEIYYEFGWSGVMGLALLFPLFVHLLFRRSLRAGARASVAYFAMLKPLLMFAIINQVFERPFLITLVTALILDRIIRHSTRRALVLERTRLAHGLAQESLVARPS